MDSHRSKRRSFSKSKLIMPFYRVTKPSAAALQPYSSKPPKPSPANSSPGSFEFAANQQIKPKPPPSSAAAGSPVGFIIVNQDQVFPQQTPKVATFVVADRNLDSYGKLENFYGGRGGAAADDEGVDARAAKYISSVQERFRLEHGDSEHKNLEDIYL